MFDNVNKNYENMAWVQASESDIMKKDLVIRIRDSENFPWVKLSNHRISRINNGLIWFIDNQDKWQCAVEYPVNCEILKELRVDNFKTKLIKSLIAIGKEDDYDIYNEDKRCQVKGRSKILEDVSFITEDQIIFISDSLNKYIKDTEEENKKLKQEIKDLKSKNEIREISWNKIEESIKENKKLKQEIENLKKDKEKFDLENENREGSFEKHYYKILVLYDNAKDNWGIEQNIRIELEKEIENLKIQLKNSNKRAWEWKRYSDNQSKEISILKQKIHDQDFNTVDADIFEKELKSLNEIIKEQKETLIFKEKELRFLDNELQKIKDAIINVMRVRKFK